MWRAPNDIGHVCLHASLAKSFKLSGNLSPRAHGFAKQRCHCDLLHTLFLASNTVVRYTSVMRKLTGTSGILWRLRCLCVIAFSCFLIAGVASASTSVSTADDDTHGLPIWLLYVAAQTAVNENAVKPRITASPAAFVAGEVLYFDAAASNGGNGIRYSWMLISPDGSQAELSSESGIGVNFEPDRAGTYTLVLTMTGANGAQAEDRLVFEIELPQPEALPSYEPTAPPLPSISDEADAVRLLYQSTFGLKIDDVQNLMEVGVDSWFSHQLSIDPVGYVEAWASLAEEFNDLDGFDGANGVELNHETFMLHALYSPDQLRHRMTYALSQLLVISSEFDFSHHDQLTLGYADILYNNAFGNYRDLLKQVTLHPAMGMFLAMLGNEKADPSRNIRPDENYAREIMQLFTIGLQELNQDGTPRLDSEGEIIQTYGPVDVQNYAAALTGWYFANLEPYRFGDSFHSVPWHMRLPQMTAYDDYHQKTPKKLLRNYYVQAGASAEESLEAVLDSLFYHPNLAPFVSLHLIKSFVTSNPSPEYVGRVAAVFNSNENGERGNLSSVIQAVLFDHEARSSIEEQPANYGRAKDPLTRFLNYWRFFNVQGYDPERREELRRSPRSQQFLNAPSVFNFFSPNHVPSAAFSDLDLVAPELQIITPETLVNMSGHFAYTNSLEELELCCSDFPEEQKLTWLYYDLGTLPTLQETSGTEFTIDFLNTYLMQGRLSEASRNDLFEIYDPQFQSTLDSGNREAFLGTFRGLIYQLVSSPEYSIQR